MKIKINDKEIANNIPEKNAVIEFVLEDGTSLFMDVETFVALFKNDN